MRAAAVALGTSHSTVLRRIEVLEHGLQASLFVRRRGGYELTPVGQQAFEAGCVVEDAMAELRRQVQGHDRSLSGHVRMALPDSLLPIVLTLLEPFADRHPEITLELVTGTSYVDLERREADLALRIASKPDDQLVGRRLGVVRVGIIGSRGYADRVPPRRPPKKLDWIGWERGSVTAFGSWIEDNIPAQRVRIRVDGPSSLVQAVEHGYGVTLLPMALASGRDWHSFGIVEAFDTPLWVLSHEDLRTTARVRAVRDFLAQAFERNKVLSPRRRRNAAPDKPSRE